MDIHTYFNLSYTSHLVVDPVVLRAAPEQLQADLDTMIGQLDRAFPDVNRAGDEMLALAAVDREYGELDDEELKLIGAADEATHDDCEHGDDEDDDCDAWDTKYYDWRGDEHRSSEYVQLPTETLEQARAAGRRVISRTLLQSMPEDWQEQFVALLQQFRGAAENGPEAYDIRFYTRDGHRTTDSVPHYQRGRTHIEPRLEAIA